MDRECPLLTAGYRLSVAQRGPRRWLELSFALALELGHPNERQQGLEWTT